MDCFYINLDSAKTRKIHLEQSFSEHKREHWNLRRFSAIDADCVQSNNVPGTLAPSAKACFLSHRQIIKSNLTDERPILLMEDDVALGRHTCEAVDNLLRNEKTLDWDVAFTDVCIPLLQTMVDLVRLRRQLAATGQIVLLDLVKMVFGGSAAYVVNGRSKRKLAAMLDATDSLSIPYDLFLRKLVYEKKLSAFVFFPFITSLSDFSEVSQIQTSAGSAADLLWNTFRKLIWMDRDLKRQETILGEITSRLCDEESRVFGPIFAAMASKEYQPK